MGWNQLQNVGDGTPIVPEGMSFAEYMNIRDNQGGYYYVPDTYTPGVTATTAQGAVQDAITTPWNAANAGGLSQLLAANPNTFSAADISGAQAWSADKIAKQEKQLADDTEPTWEDFAPAAMLAAYMWPTMAGFTGGFGGFNPSELFSQSGGITPQVGGVSGDLLAPMGELGSGTWSGFQPNPSLVGDALGASGVNATGATGLGLDALGAYPGAAGAVSGAAGSLMPPTPGVPSGGFTEPPGNQVGPATGGAPTNQSALQWLSQVTGIPTGLLSALGTGVATGLGVYGSDQQTDAYKDLAQKYMDFGAPSRSRFEASMTPGFDVNSIPGYKGAVDTASESLLRRLSATGGNPFGNPGGLIEANKAIISGTALPAFNEYARLNANTGFGSSMNAAVPFQTAAIGSDANGLNALGYGLGQLTQPPKQDLASMLRQLTGSGQLSLT